MSNFFLKSYKILRKTHHFHSIIHAEPIFVNFFRKLYIISNIIYHRFIIGFAEARELGEQVWCKGWVTQPLRDQKIFIKSRLQEAGVFKST